MDRLVEMYNCTTNNWSYYYQSSNMISIQFTFIIWKKCNNNCHTHTHTHTTFPWCWYQNMNTQKKSNAIYESLNWFKLYSHRQHADADDDDDHNPVGYKQSFTYLYIIINVYKFQDFRCNKFILFFRFDA